MAAAVVVAGTEEADTVEVVVEDVEVSLVRIPFPRSIADGTNKAAVRRFYLFQRCSSWRE
jgi:hypothetical protein